MHKGGEVKEIHTKFIRRVLCVRKSNNGKNWAYQIKTFFKEIGMSNIWIQQDKINLNIQTIKCRILDIYAQNWYSNINNSNRLKSYNLFKFEFDHEKYLDLINIDKYKK